MESISVGKSTKDRLIRLGGSSSPDETIRCLLERLNRLARFVEARNEQIAELKRTEVPDMCRLLDQNYDIAQENWKSDACEGCNHYENGECPQL